MFICACKFLQFICVTALETTGNNRFNGDNDVRVIVACKFLL